MVKKDFYYPSSDGKTRIHAISWEPDGEPVGIVQIIHGMIEFIGSSKDNYEDLFETTGYRRMYSFDGMDHYGEKDGEDYDFAVSCTEKNSWFAVYRISEDYPIEDLSSK